MRFFTSTALKILRINALILLILSLGSLHGSAQTGTQTVGELLDSSKPVKRKIAGGENHYYRIMLVADQYVRLVVDQRGIDVSVKLYQPDGKLVADSNRLIGAYGPETISWVAGTSGFYKLHIRPSQADQIAADYEVQITTMRFESSRCEKEVIGIAAVSV